MNEQLRYSHLWATKALETMIDRENGLVPVTEATNTLKQGGFHENAITKARFSLKLKQRTINNQLFWITDKGN